MEGRLYIVWNGSTLQKRNANETSNNLQGKMNIHNDAASKAALGQMIANAEAPALGHSLAAGPNPPPQPKPPRQPKELTPTQVALKAIKATVVKTNKRVQDIKAIQPALRKMGHQWPIEIADNLDKHVEALNDEIRLLQDAAALRSDDLHALDTAVEKAKKVLEQAEEEYALGCRTKPREAKPKAKGKARAKSAA